MHDSEQDFDVFRPDVSRIEEELADQPQLYAVYASDAVQADYDYDQAKVDCDQAKIDREEVEARLDILIRQGQIRHGFEKLTESLVTSLIRTQPEYIKARNAEVRAAREANEAKARAAQLRVWVKTIEQRKGSLEDACKLLVGDIYAEPRVPKLPSAHLKAKLLGRKGGVSRDEVAGRRKQ